MRYLALLLLLVGCSDSPRFKVGDCATIVTSSNVLDIYIVSIIKNNYIVSPKYSTRRYPFSFDELDEYAIKIECSEVE